MEVRSLSDKSIPGRGSGCGVRKKSPAQIEAEKLNRQMTTLVKKMNRMANHFTIDIALHARYRGRQRIYTSSTDLSWPPNIQEVVVSKLKRMRCRQLTGFRIARTLRHLCRLPQASQRIPRHKDKYIMQMCRAPKSVGTINDLYPRWARSSRSCLWDAWSSVGMPMSQTAT